jgi:Zn-dependent M28 family amino/carboxypeptidase
MDPARFPFFRPRVIARPMPEVVVTTIRSLSLGLLLLASCRPETTITPDESPPPVVELPKRPTIDAQAMLASIEWLASDERQGRFTFAPEIEQTATWIGERYEELGLEPVSGAETMRVGYRLRTKVEVGEGASLTITRNGKPVAVPAEQFTPRAEGISGTAKGELVFVGYGVSWAGDAKPEIASYDDLAGVDLNGKIALVLAQAPNTPDLLEMVGALQKLAEDFEAAAAPLREADNLAKLGKLHRKVREDLAEMVSPFVDTKDLGDAYWKVEDPKAGVDIMSLASVFLSRTAERPQFDPDAIKHSAKVERLAAAGAIGVIIVQGPRSFTGKAAGKADVLPGAMDQRSSGGAHSRVVPDPIGIPVVQLRHTNADKLLSIGGQKLSKLQAAIDADYKPRSQALGIEVELTSALVDEAADVPNVLAQLPGKTDEIIMLGAHFDHIGNDETGNCRAIVRKDDRDAICNGADDNASGTAMLLELARVYKQSGITPERTIVFAHFSGEEIGLLGSRALMQTSPFDQSRVVAMVNLDMVGRLGPRGLAIGGIGSSADWMPLLDELGNYEMQILYEGSTTTRSDHAHWFRKQIPVLFFFTGMHGDYHRAGDEIDEINVEGLGSIGQMVSDVIWELAGGRSISWTPPASGDGIGSGLPGSDPSTVVRHVMEDGSPAVAEE